ncbi:MAG TPA: hypothetical protein VMV91_05670 [Rhodocyclaceae bacterium]|nr:hypothetical protein [Rhodocyclaceae bacterium]
MRRVFVESTRRFSAQVALLTLTGFSVPAPAYQPLITDDTGTQGGGGNQLEFSFNEDREKEPGNIERLRTLPIVYTRGLTGTLDVYAGFSYARFRSSTSEDEVSGGGNPSFGAKWRFYEKSQTSFAVKPELLFPVSANRESAGLGAGKTSGSLTLVLTQNVPFGAIHINAAVGRARYRDPLNNPDTTTMRTSIAPVWDLTDQWRLALDLGTESAHAEGTRLRSNFLELGAIYSPSKDLDFALGIVRTSGSPRTTKHTATAGITWRFR